MRLYFVFAIFACGLMAADARRPEGIPKTAVQTSADSWEYKDAEGRTWYYRRSPFGWMKTGGLTEAERKKAETAPPPEKRDASPFGPIATTKESAPGQASSVEIKVREAGESLEFERPTPFGPVKWTRKKSELKPDEQSAWDRHRSATAKVQK